ncbi:unnamed protein product [Rotaria sp. Silwood2]|nr:unnamed protein product [Rotaria sp. Silwood2]CAF4142587.1 unnamed protein product [Rotaria sp. Silwood2]
MRSQHPQQQPLEKYGCSQCGSAGQIRLVSLACTLYKQPQLILLDEITVDLDPLLDEITVDLDPLLG